MKWPNPLLPLGLSPITTLCQQPSGAFYCRDQLCSSVDGLLCVVLGARESAYCLRHTSNGLGVRGGMHNRLLVVIAHPTLCVVHSNLVVLSCPTGSDFIPGYLWSSSGPVFSFPLVILSDHFPLTLSTLHTPTSLTANPLTPSAKTHCLNNETCLYVCVGRCVSVCVCIAEWQIDIDSNILGLLHVL